MLIQKLMRSLIKKKQGKIANSKKIETEKCGGRFLMNFFVKTFQLSSNFFNNNGILFSDKMTAKNNKYDQI